jgi:hypothetical protein
MLPAARTSRRRRGPCNNASCRSRENGSSERKPGIGLANGASPPTTIVDCELNHNAEHPVDERTVMTLTRTVRGLTAPSVAIAFLLAGCSLAPPPPDNGAALREIAARESGAELVVQGRVLRVYPSAEGPSGTHERFVVQVQSGTSSLGLFVADNVSIASAAPLHPGDEVVVKGELAFNDLGPVLHWTHRDPRLRHQPGFVEVGGHLYE